MQMLLNKGSYGGEAYFKPETVNLFTAQYHADSRRGLGFDKPETNLLKATPAGKFSSALCYGHTGFTGTCAWADPKNGLVYVFLSNRINPTADNKKLAETNVRTRIHDLFNEIVRKK
jgi:CubicO group peptidase (beta-lactamase class C family)